VADTIARFSELNCGAPQTESVEATMVRNSELASDIIKPPESITQSALGGLDKQIDAAVDAHSSSVMIDFSGVESIDSAGLNWLLEAQTRLARTDIALLIQNPSPFCLDVFIATRLETRLKIVATKPETIEETEVRNG
jgi:anti-anti-sigma factor